MDSGNSGSISSSGDEEYDSRSEPVPATFLNPSSHLSFLSHPSLFDLSPGYLHSLSQSQPNSKPINSLPYSDTAGSEPDYTDPANIPPGASSSLSALAPTNQPNSLRSVHEDNRRPSAPANVVLRPSKKRPRASRRAPTTVLTTDTSNFRAMVQEFTGIPAPPFPGGLSYSRRLDLLAGSSSFYPLRASAQKILPNPLLMSTSSLSSSSSSPSTLLQNNTVDAIASTTHNITSQLPPFDLGLPYNHSQNISMYSMQNPPVLTFQPPPLPFQPLGNTLSGFSAKPQESLSMASLEDLGMSRLSVPAIHGHEGRSPEGRREELRSFDGSYGKVGGS